MEDILLFSTIISPIILALVEVFKVTLPKFNKNYIPLVAIIIGIFVGWAAQPFSDLDLVLRLWSGGLAGLGATGLFELVKPEKFKNTGGK